MSLQEQVKAYLAENGIKKKHLAKILEMYPTQLSQWLAGNYTLNSFQLKRVDDFLSGNS